MLEATGGLKLWQVGVLVAVLVLGIGGSYGGYKFATRTADDELDGDQQLFAVTTADLINEVSVSGSLVFPNRETLTFGQQGTVGEVLVEEGDSVVEGQPLATLDEESIATLEKALAQAEVNLQDAEAALDKARTPFTTLDIAQVEADVANAEASLQSAGEALADLMETSPHVLAQAESKVASSKLSVSDAEDALEVLMGPTEQEVVRATLNITDARVSVARALEALEDLTNGPDEDGLVTAQSRIDSAETSLANAELDLAVDRNDWDGKLDNSSDALDTVADLYADVYTKWLGIEFTDTEKLTDPDTLLESWNADLVSLFDPTTRFTDLVPYVAVVGVPLDDPATRWDEATVYLWANFFPGEIKATCDSGAFAVQNSCVRREIDDAWESVPVAMDNLETLELQAAKALSNAETAAERAQDDLVEAQDALSDLFVEPDPLDVETAEMSVDLAKVALQDAQDALADLNDGPDSVEVEANEKQLAVAQTALAQAEEDLAELLSGPDPVDFMASQKQFDLAAARLADTREALDEMLEGPDPVVVALREADVAASVAALASARTRLDEATLTSPLDAVVSAIGVEPGQQVNANTPAFEVVDESVIEVDGVVDEIDVLFVQEGASASVTMDALPGQVLSGAVSEIAAAAQSQQGVVSYPISIRIEVPRGLSLPEGLSAVGSVIIREDRGVLLVPIDAVYGSFEQPVVRVMNNGVAEDRPVSLGNSDDFWIVVESGIVEGDRVIMQSREASTAGSGFAALRGQFAAFGGNFRRPPGGGPGGGR